MSFFTEIKAKDRLIVALDVPTVDEALRAVDRLKDISFFKIGLQLWLTGAVPELLERLREKRVFVDLKIPGDIGNTISSVIDFCVAADVAFLTLSESMPLPSIRVAKAARDRHKSQTPKLLTVPFLSSLDGNDLREIAGEVDVETFILKRAHAATEAGCDGVIASGDAIAVCRRAFPRPFLVVSPGIRPAGSSTDEHKRHTTPGDAIRLGADFLVIGRPILQASDPAEVATRVVDEIEEALSQTHQ